MLFPFFFSVIYWHKSKLQIKDITIIMLQFIISKNPTHSGAFCQWEVTEVTASRMATPF
jgi:hypothetical protein